MADVGEALRTAIILIVGSVLFDAAGAQTSEHIPASSEDAPPLQPGDARKRGWRLLSEGQCVALTDGCNFMVRRPYDPGRYIKRGYFAPLERARPRTAWVLSLDAPATGLAASASALDCPIRHEFVCIKGSPPPAPPREGPPTGLGWLEESELHQSWIDLAPQTHSIGCHPFDYNLLIPRTGELPTRRPPSPSASLCTASNAIIR